MSMLSPLLMATGWFSLGAPACGPWGSGYGPGMMGWGFGGFFGPILMVLFWMFVIMGTVYLVRYAFDPKRSAHQESALDMAKKRYARGEISREEFESLKEDLKKS